MRKPDGELLASNGETNRHDIVTVRLSARDPHARVIVATQAEHNIREARVKKKAVTRTTGMLIQQTTHVLQASPRRYRTFRIVMAARYPRFARMRATVCHRRVKLGCMRALWREAAAFCASIWSLSERRADRARECRIPCRRDELSYAINGGLPRRRTTKEAHYQGGAHEPSHCFVRRDRCLDRYLNCRGSCAGLRTRLVLQRATLRAAARHGLSATPPSSRRIRGRRPRHTASSRPPPSAPLS